MILVTASQILGTRTAPESAGTRIEIGKLLRARISGGAGLVLNLSEGGMAIQTMVSLQAGQTVEFHLPLREADAELAGTAEVAWSDCSGRVGLHFKDLSEPDRLWLKDWLRQGKGRAFPRMLGQQGILQGPGSSRSSALLNAEVNCLQFLANQGAERDSL